VGSDIEAYDSPNDCLILITVEGQTSQTDPRVKNLAGRLRELSDRYVADLSRRVGRPIGHTELIVTGQVRVPCPI
jgi:hypothetical protein